MVKWTYTLVKLHKNCHPDPFHSKKTIESRVYSKESNYPTMKVLTILKYFDLGYVPNYVRFPISVSRRR